MANRTLLLPLLLSFLCLALAQKKSHNITLGSSLTPTNISAWLSSSGFYAFGFYPQGNGYNLGVYMANISEKTVVWTANRDEPPMNSNSTLILSNEGKLILYGDNKTIVETPKPIYLASMLNSGNFVLYGPGYEVIWQSFDYPTDTILPGQSLKAGNELVSRASKNDQSSGIFCLRMQLDGNLVQYPVGDVRIVTAYYASNTVGYNNASLNLDNHGNLYMLNSTLNFKNLTQGNRTKEEAIFLMRLDEDGFFRTYSHTLHTKGNWLIKSELPTKKGEPKGLCGLNAYYVELAGTTDCKCLSGFDYVNPINRTRGCQRNFTADGCKNKNETIKYNMIELESTTWEDVSYSVLSSKTKEECQNACLEDCNCEVAFFKDDGSCSKQRLPLRYGKNNFQDSTYSVLIKSFDPVPNPFQTLLPTRVREKKARNYILIISSILVFIAFIVLAISGIFIFKSRDWAYKKVSKKEIVEVGEDVSLRSFTFAELKQITNEFREELGRGAYGTVYKGIISQNQQVVAVKKLERWFTDGERELQTEIKVIGRTHHRNLVRLIGYCLEESNRLLVYEYMNNGSLADLLVRPDHNRPVWDERISVALDIARGILYLHEECETQIIHCDIKPQNILMNERMRAKICDFGLVKLLKPNQTKTYTGIRGTRGYVAPEWHRNLPITVKADVYSFGVVLLEIICCRRSVNSNLSEEEAVLEKWVYDCFEAKNLKKLVGDHEEVNAMKLEKLVKVGLWCIQDEASLRPSMKKVVLMLEGTVEIPVPPSPTSFLNTI